MAAHGMLDAAWSKLILHCVSVIGLPVLRVSKLFVVTGMRALFVVLRSKTLRFRIQL